MLELYRNLKRLHPDERREYFLKAYKKDLGELRMYGAPRWMLRWLERQVERCSGS